MSEPPRPPRPPKRPPPEVVPSPRIGRLAQELGRDGGALARFWAEVEGSGTPLVEPADRPGHNVVTFLWRDRHGTGPGTAQVVLMANKLTDPSVWEQSLLERLPGTDVWHRSYRLRSDWRCSYQFAPADRASRPAPDLGGPTSRWRGLAEAATVDPLNRHPFPGRHGTGTLSVVELPQAPPQPWVRRRDGVAASGAREERLASRILGDERRLWVREPTTAGRAGLLVLLDGEDWSGRLDAGTILDNLEADGAVAPLLTVMVAAGDRERRWRELRAEQAFLDFLARELVPWARERWGLDPRPDATTIGGQSLGGLTALFAALRAADTFGGVVAQSSSLWWGPEEDPEPGWMVRELAAHPPRGVRFSLEVGRQEWVLLDAHRELRRVLEAVAPVTRYVEYEGGHDIVCWRGGLAEGLISLAEGGGSGAATARSG